MLGAKAAILRTAETTGDRVLRPVVRIKRAAIADRYRQVRVDFRGGFFADPEAYDDGVAYRFVLAKPGEVTIEAEEASFEFSGNPLLYFPEDTGLISHQERPYKKVRLVDIKTAAFAYPPVLVVPDEGPKVAITEADLLDYPGMSPQRAPRADLRDCFPALRRNRNGARPHGAGHETGTLDRAHARHAGVPPRVLVIARDDKVLLESDIIYRLASDNAIGEAGWIRPGKVAWDWWNFNNIYGVPFRAGVNTDTYSTTSTLRLKTASTT